jgi:hypothetical protein
VARSVHLACEIGLFVGELGRGAKTLSASTGSSLSLGRDFGDPRGLELQGGVDGVDDEVAVGR